MNEDDSELVIYTDGSCSGNPGVGGWGVIIVHRDGTHEELSGGEKLTTNNKMELTAAIVALKKIAQGSTVKIYTDSQYVKNGITLWIKSWVKNGWKNSQKQSVKNKELWIELLEIAQKHDIEWCWVKGHDGNEMNERADELARIGCCQAQLQE